ncbi:oxidoreductase of aldo/keto reductase family [Candidatus Magnetoovum chiemensis]|nr:oxidoreductase of aldo/keto reductase family [Candidatus Magnetoovum chiemensis]
MGIIAMKVYLRGFASKLPFYQTMEPYFRFALSQPISTAVIGCDNTAQLLENVKYAAAFKPMDNEEMQQFIDIHNPYARQIMYYKP